MRNHQKETLQSKSSRFSDNHLPLYFVGTCASLLGFSSVGALVANQMPDPVMGALAGGVGSAAGFGTFISSLVGRAPLSKKANVYFIAGATCLGAVMGGVTGAGISELNVERAVESVGVQASPIAP